MSSALCRRTPSRTSSWVRVSEGAGAGNLRVLLPIANKAQFAGLPEDVVEKLDLVFYGEVDRAVLKTLEL